MNDKERAIITAVVTHLEAIREDSAAVAMFARGFCANCEQPIVDVGTERPDLDLGFRHEDGRATCPDGKGQARPSVDMQRNGWMASLNGPIEDLRAALNLARQGGEH